MTTETHEFGRKPRSKATINPAGAQMAHRHAGRILRLRDAIARAQKSGNTGRVASLQEELDRRLAHIQEIKAELDNL